MSPWICAVVALVALAIPSGEAVKCFVCNSDGHTSCDDPFNYGHLPLVDCERRDNPNNPSYLGVTSVCKKTKTRINGRPMIDRTCAWEQNYGNDPCNQAQSSYAYTEHCSICRYDGCNGAASMGPAFWTIAASAIAYTTVKCL